MTVLTVILAIVVLAFAAFLYLPARTLAAFTKTVVPLTLILFGAGMIFAKQVLFGTMALWAGIGLWLRMRNITLLQSANAGPSRSSVRSAALEMELDHDNGSMNGIVLAGQFEGRELDMLSDDDLMVLRKEILQDGESLALLDSYLDRRFAAWGEDTEADAGAGQAGPASSGPMSKEEAYEVLGLASGASVSDITKAHRRLMKTAHPDSGGSTFLASKINEAKDVLLRGHS